MAHHSTSPLYSIVETPSRVSTPSKVESFEGQVPPFLEGLTWCLSISTKELTKLQTSLRIPRSMEFIFPPEGASAVDDEGFSRLVALTACALTSELQLPYCRPVHDILNLF